MAVIDKIKVKAVIQKYFHDSAQDANMVDLTVEYMNEYPYPDFNSEFTTDEEVSEGYVDGNITYGKIEQVVDDNVDVVLEYIP